MIQASPRELTLSCVLREVGRKGEKERGRWCHPQKGLSVLYPLQLFEGNMHYDTPDIRRFDPVPAQFVRVYPERWSPAGIGMRLEVLGCDWTGKASYSSPQIPTTHSFPGCL